MIGDTQTAGHEHPQLSCGCEYQLAGFYALIRPYLEDGTRHGDVEYLGQILQLWSPQLDPGNDIHAALFEIVDRGDELGLQMLLDAGVSPRLNQQGDPYFTPLLAAAQAGQLGMARRLWELLGPEERFQLPRNRISCLQIAAENGRAELVTFFLDVWDGWTAKEREDALVGAAATRWDECVDVLLTRLTYEQKDLQKALWWAIHRRMIITEDPVDGLRRKELGGVTLNELEADTRRRQHRVICHLVDAGANPDGPGLYVPDGLLLHYAAIQLDYPGCMGALLEKGANASIEDAWGETALHLLLRKGPSIEYRGFQDTPQDRMAVTQLLLDHGASPDTANSAGETALHLAAQYGSVEQLQLCVSPSRLTDAAIRQPNRQGETPLHYAAASGRDEMVEYLLANGDVADIDTTGHNGWTPLLCALSPSRKHKSEEMAVRVAARLLTGGASACLVTAEGWSALHAVASWISGSAAEAASRSRYRRAHRYDPTAREQLVRLAHELIRRGAPLDAEPAFLRDATVTPDRLDGVWGFRMQELARSIGREKDAVTRVNDGAGGAVSDTTPLAWAIRTNAMDLVQVILNSLQPTIGDRPA